MAFGTMLYTCGPLSQDQRAGQALSVLVLAWRNGIGLTLKGYASRHTAASEGRAWKSF